VVCYSSLAPKAPVLYKVPERHELVSEHLLCISFDDNRPNVVAICVMIERSNGTEPEEDIVGTANQASSHFHMFTSNVYTGKEELFRSPRNPLKCEELGGVEKTFSGRIEVQDL